LARQDLTLEYFQIRRRSGHEQLAYFPLVTGWVGNAADAPSLFFMDRCNLSCSGHDRSGEYGIRVVNGQDHPDGRSAAQGVRA